MGIDMDLFSESANVKKIIREREKWLETLNIPDREETLFAIELFLKSVDRFFNLENHPQTSADPVTRNFSVEVRIIRDVIRDLKRLFDETLAAEDSSAFVFQRYIESRLLPDSARDKFYEKYLKQPTPRDSLYLLIISFENIYEVINNILMLPKVGLSLFQSLGQIITRNIMINKYFNPFIYKGFSPLYDKITNPAINRVVKNITDPQLKRVVSILILTFNRFLHYLRYINMDEKSLELLRKNIVIFTLINSELKSFLIFLEKNVPDILSVDNPSDFTSKRGEFLDLVDSINFQITLEMRKINHQILKNFCQLTNILRIRSALENAQGILKNFFQQNIVHILKIFQPDLDGKDVFRDFISRLEESLRLREDVYIFIKIVEKLVSVLEDPDARKSEIRDVIRGLTDFIAYFQSLAFKSVRYSDHEKFVEFFDWFARQEWEEIIEKKGIKPELIQYLKGFQIFLETVLVQIGNRSELQNVPFEREQAEIILKQFIS